jgi:tetratricopeptide (TPR) repeat protein
MRIAAGLIALYLATATPALAQTVQAGDVAFANSGAQAAQAPFLTGLALLHDFEYRAAKLAFQRAEAADPNFAMAYWGEAMTYNHPVWMQQDAAAARAALAKLGPTPEARTAKAGTPRERDYLAAVEILYGDGDKAARDFRYADAMAALHARYPDDVDATAFDALALLGTSHDGRDEATYMKSAALLEEVFPTHLRHPGVLHYMIHSYDDPIHAPLGLRAARRYGALAPDAPHALHMTSHIFIALGMWDETIAANEAAIRAETAHDLAAGRTPDGCGHYADWLFYADLQEGRDAEAQAGLAACRVSALTDKRDLGEYEGMRVMRVVDTGRWDPAEAPPSAGPPSAEFTFMEAYGQAVAALRAGDSAALNAASIRLTAATPAFTAEVAADPSAGRSDRESPALMADQIAAVARLRGGDTDGGLSGLRKVAEAETSLPMEFGPPVVALPTWELLGDELLRAHRPADAVAAYKAALARAPGRTRALKGLAEAQRLAGDAAGAAVTQAELAKYLRGG